MEEVYRAADTRLKRQVALKIMPPEMAGKQERLERFQRVGGKGPAGVETALARGSAQASRRVT